MMDMISAHDDIDRRVHLDPGDLGPAKLHHIVDMMDMVILDQAEHTAHPADDAALLTVVDITPADNMSADEFLQPPMVLSPADRIPLHLGRALDMLRGEIMVVIRVIVFPEPDAGALGIADFTVLDDPAL
jgi:hypothetical protein